MLEQPVVQEPLVYHRCSNLAKLVELEGLVSLEVPILVMLEQPVVQEPLVYHQYSNLAKLVELEVLASLD